MTTKRWKNEKGKHSFAHKTLSSAVCGRTFHYNAQQLSYLLLSAVKGVGDTESYSAGQNSSRSPYGNRLD